MLSLTITVVAIAASIATMAITGNAAPSGAATASTDASRSTSGRRAHPTHVVVAENSVEATSDTLVSKPAAVVHTPAKVRVAVANVVSPVGQNAATDVSPLAADGIPVTALHAYQDAAAAVATTDPGCRIPWPLLAGIGRVESDHGRFAGATLYTSGTSSAKILGPILDGNGTAVIRDTDSGLLDGDTSYDRAMGPLQFIPSTWANYASDGNHDGIQDPFNIFDESLAAAKYLCAAGGDLATTAGQVRAVFAYNHLTSYVDTVLALEHAYATGAGVIVPDPPAATKTKVASTKPVSKPVTAPAPKSGHPAAPVPAQPTPVSITPAKPGTPTKPVTPTTLNCPTGTQPIPIASGASAAVPTPAPATGSPVAPNATVPAVPGAVTTSPVALMPDGKTPVPAGCMLVPVPTAAPTSTG
ncbi:lytic murein transglycosylase [uncultured Jatrophihabitans sp.]|uniref:lytic transglycosylase domain-containing protein n=1 Tax=uncultured Jatrophihabitans sp. TaxID=1610747 RepID=UPI0035C97785